MRVLFQHITPENPGNIELPGQNVQNRISQQSFGTTYALPLTGFLKEPHQRTPHSPPKPRSCRNATTDSNCRAQGQRLKPGQAPGEAGAGASGWAVGAVGVRGVGLEQRFLRARGSRHSLHRGISHPYTVAQIHSHRVRSGLDLWKVARLVLLWAQKAEPVAGRAMSCVWPSGSSLPLRRWGTSLPGHPVRSTGSSASRQGERQTGPPFRRTTQRCLGAANRESSQARPHHPHGYQPAARVRGTDIPELTNSRVWEDKAAPY